MRYLLLPATVDKEKMPCRFSDAKNAGALKTQPAAITGLARTKAIRWFASAVTRLLASGMVGFRSVPHPE